MAVFARALISTGAEAQHKKDDSPGAFLMVAHRCANHPQDYRKITQNTMSFKFLQKHFDAHVEIFFVQCQRISNVTKLEQILVIPEEPFCSSTATFRLQNRFHFVPLGKLGKRKVRYFASEGTVGLESGLQTLTPFGRGPLNCML